MLVRERLFVHYDRSAAPTILEVRCAAGEVLGVDTCKVHMIKLLAAVCVSQCTVHSHTAPILSHWHSGSELHIGPCLCSCLLIDRGSRTIR